MSLSTSSTGALALPPLGLYVHFPWCVRKCPYCDFNSHTLHGTLPEASYLEALIQDLAAQSGAAQGRPVSSVFFGGGTPSLIAPRAIGALLESIDSLLPLSADAEITLEANPGTIERGRFSEYRAAGVNRVSLGAQSFAAEQLQRLGRIHSPEDTHRAVEELKAAGLGNFNLDLMYALPGQDLAAALADVETAIALAPAHLSHYQLTLEPGTVFGALPPANLPSEETSAGMMEECQAKLAEAGYAQYEISAYAREGAQCRHNLNYWRFGDYLGIGAGAHGKYTDAIQQRILRTVREREPRRYLAHGALAAVPTQSVAPEELPFEFMLNALRLPAGFEQELFEARTGEPFARVAATITDLENRGLMQQSAGRWRASELGLRFLNDLLTAFLPARPAGGSRAAPRVS
ncbi:MAG: radical SAM family heme chaperone HemW [Steroidobacteraceae bacterium]